MKLTPAECVYEAFGGVRETARILGITAGGVVRWQQQRRHLKAGEIPQHHFRVILIEAQNRGKRLTLEDLAFGREPPVEGVVIVKDGRKVEIKMHDTYMSMVNTLVGA